MRSLSVIQPWAWLLAAGIKTHETRSWPTFHHGPIAIHASKRSKTSDEACEHLIHEWYDLFTAYGIETADDLTYGAVIGTATLAGCHRAGTMHGLLSDQELELGDFSPGRFAWEMRDAILLPQPIPYRGERGIWDFPDELIAKAA